MASSSDTGLFVLFVGFTAMCCWNPAKDVTAAIEEHTDVVEEQTKIIERAVLVLEGMDRQEHDLDEDNDINPDESEAVQGLP